MGSSEFVRGEFVSQSSSEVIASMSCLVVGDPVEVMAKYDCRCRCQVVPKQRWPSLPPFAAMALSQTIGDGLDVSDACWDERDVISHPLLM